MPKRREKVVTIGALSQPDRSDWLEARILALLREGRPRSSWDPARREWGFRGEWLVPPGACSWWEMRQRVGGRVNTVEFRAAVDGLLAGGEVLEVWLAMPDGREPAHTLLLPGHSGVLRHPVAQARGLPEVLRGEPWAATLTPPLPRA
jgi:hypothetical protein